MKIAIFVSGNGTNMENLIKRVQAGELTCEVSFVLCDKPEAGAIEKAKRLGVEAVVVDRKACAGREEFENRIIEQIESHQIDLIVLAGFMRILSVSFVQKYMGRIINVHPSLLPDFPGAHSIRDAFEARAKETGVTIHFVDEGVDSGQIILQDKVAIDPEDTLESLEAKVHALEYELYPKALALVFDGKVKMKY